jgi:glycosyltransferase involved in cell wall biosynthesis
VNRYTAVEIPRPDSPIWQRRRRDGIAFSVEPKVMRISIIVACLNAERLLSRCLESVASQDYEDIELVVADGGSRDGTLEVVNGYRSRMGDSLRLFSGKDRGIADAWNKAVALADGDWLLFLGADDSLAAPNVISRAASCLDRATPRYRVVYGQVAQVDADGCEVGLLDRTWSQAAFRSCQYNLPHQGVFHHRSLFGEYGWFDTSFRISADFDFLLRVLAHAEPMYVPGLTVTRMQVGGLSSTRLNAPRVVMEEIRLYRRHNGDLPLTLTWWLIKAWGKFALFSLGGDDLALPVTNLYRRLVRGQGPLRY